MSHARFSIIPAWVVTDPRLKGRDLQVLCLLGRHTDRGGWCRRSQVKMAVEMAVSRGTVQASLGRLYELGVVEKHEEVSADGRDSAHWYRVILDRPPPEGFAFDAWLDGEQEENISETEGSGDDDQTPPANILAGGASPELAPPASSGLAPINVPSLTTHDQRKERESASADVLERESDTAADNRGAAERAFKRWHPTWPTYVTDSQPEARKAWMELSSEDRAQAAEMAEAYIAASKAAGRKMVCSAGVYLRERRWEKLPAKPVEPAKPEMAKPFGKAWMAARMMELARDPRPEAMWPAPSQFVRNQLAEGGALAEQVRGERLLRHGFPKVYDMDEAARINHGAVVKAQAVTSGADFVSTDLDGEVGQAWRRLFGRLNLPWLPSVGNGPRYAYLPAIGDGADDFDKAVSDAFWAFKAKVGQC